MKCAICAPQARASATSIHAFRAAIHAVTPDRWVFCPCAVRTHFHGSWKDGGSMMDPSDMEAGCHGVPPGAAGEYVAPSACIVRWRITAKTKS